MTETDHRADEPAVPAPGSPHLGPTERMAAVLRHLSWTRGIPVPREELREITPDYDGEQGRRLLEQDLAELGHRGFVETAPSVAEVRLTTPREKHRAFHLSHEEHAALSRARARLRPGPATVEVREGPGHGLDMALAVVRYLEDGVGGASGRRTAEALGVSVEALHEVLTALAANPAVDPETRRSGRPVLHGLHLGAEEYDQHGRLQDFRMSLDQAVPTQRGLAVLGRFAYSRAETEECLDLINDCLVDARTPERDRDTLERAWNKLYAWHDLLDRVS